MASADDDEEEEGFGGARGMRSIAGDRRAATTARTQLSSIDEDGQRQKKAPLLSQRAREGSFEDARGPPVRTELFVRAPS